MFLLIVVLSVHVSFGSCIVYNTTTKRNMDRQYKDQTKHGQANTTTKRNMVLSMFVLVVVLSVHVSFGRCIACPDNTTIKRKMDRQYNDEKKHGQKIQRPKETWTGNTTTRCIFCPCFFWSLYCLSMFRLVVILPLLIIVPLLFSVMFCALKKACGVLLKSSSDMNATFDRLFNQSNEEYEKLTDQGVEITFGVSLSIR
jgi:uncharacterized membrane protein YjgN (DUF898 family)